jgi:hypothetical protein
MFLFLFILLIILEIEKPRTYSNQDQGNLGIALPDPEQLQPDRRHRLRKRGSPRLGAATLAPPLNTCFETIIL